MNQKNPIVKSTFIVFAFWWTVCNLYTLFTDPEWFWESIPLMAHSLYQTVVGFFVGIAFTASLIFLERTLALNRLQPGSFNGVTSTIGPVPILAPPAKRVKRKDCLPIESKRVKQWIEANKATHPAHVELFMAVWETLSAHKDHPASHRKGGHGGRTLAEHCMAVADTALELAPGWSYDGVYIKRPGKTPKQIIAKRDANYVFNPNDPVIPILALAHDLGKIEAYKLQADGSVLTSETGSGQDDPGVKHDALGARILARMPEYWELERDDTRALARAIAHYHHPSDFPVDKDGLSMDDRMTALMEFLILADKTTGQRESGISAASANEDAISEAEAEDIYAAFVDCVTEKGRINGTGDKDTDKTFKLGQKHGKAIYLREAQLLTAMCRKLGVSIELGKGRFILLNRILHVLNEKGLLVTVHNEVDFKEYLPLYLVRFYHSENSDVIADWPRTIIIAPTVKHPDLSALFNLTPLTTVAKLERPYFAHLSEIADSAKLADMVERAFGKEALDSLNEGRALGGGADNKTETSAPKANSTQPVTPAIAPVQVAQPAAAPLPKDQGLPEVARPVEEHAITEAPLLQAASDDTPFATHGAAAVELAETQGGIDWKDLDEEVKQNGFDTPCAAASADVTVEVVPPASEESLAAATSATGDGNDLDLLASPQAYDLDAADLDLVAGGDLGNADSEDSDLVARPETACVERPASVPAHTDIAREPQEANVQPVGIPHDHDRGIAIQDVPKDPVSNYKKQKQAEKNSENLDKLRQAQAPSAFLQQLTTEKDKRHAAKGLAGSLGLGNDRKALYESKVKPAEPEVSAHSNMSDSSSGKAAVEGFQRLIQRAVQSGTLHSLGEIEGKYFILQSMIEKCFPDADIDSQLPERFVERRSTRAGAVLLIPVAPV